MSLRRMPHALYWAAIVVVAAGLTHLCTILALPYRSSTDAYSRALAATGGVTLKTVALSPSTLGPDQDPALVTAICLFDLRRGPVVIALDVAMADVAAISVRDRYGRTLSGLTNRSASQNRLSLTVLTSVQAAHRPAPLEGTLAEIKVESTEPEGFVSAQWLASAPSEKPFAQAGVARLSCGEAQ